MDIKGNNSYKALLQCSTQPCEFCNKIFHNRFQSIIHNASHIIIPLIKQKYHRCNKCYHTFTLLRDLDGHLEAVHHIKKCSSSRLSKKKSKIKESIADQFGTSQEVKENSIHDLRPERIDNSINVEEKITQNSNLNNINNNVNVDISSINRKFIFKSDIDCNLNNTNYNKNDANECENKFNYNNNEKIEENTIKIKKEDTENDVYEPKNDGKESIKSRLQFEGDDIFDNSNVLKDFITECKVEMCDLPFNEEQVLLASHIDKGNDSKTKDNLNELLKHNGLIAFENLKDDSVGLNMDSYVRRQSISQHKGEIKSQIVETEYKSVHYKDLMERGIFNCKYCLKSYTNQFNLIKHETDHMKFKKKKPPLCTYCDRYIAGNYHHLHRHIKRMHPTGKVNKKRETYSCKDCKLKYHNYSKHLANYHPTDCSEEDDNEKNLPTIKPSRLLNVCDLCYAFMKVTNKGISPGVINQSVGKQQCEICGKKYFQLITVKPQVRRYPNGRKERRDEKDERRLSNEDRLKKIRNRFKKINRLNKFYNAVLFTSISRRVVSG